MNTNTRRASRKLTPKKLADRGRTVMRITNPQILNRLDMMLEELRNAIECRRRPGIQVGLDALLQFWFLSDLANRSVFLKRWKTPVVGYPNSIRKNPGQFARLKDVEAKRKIDRCQHGVNHPSIDPGVQLDVTPAELEELKGRVDWPEKLPYRGTIKVDDHETHVRLAQEMADDDDPPIETFDRGRLD